MNINGDIVRGGGMNAAYVGRQMLIVNTEEDVMNSLIDVIHNH